MNIGKRRMMRYPLILILLVLLAWGTPASAAPKRYIVTAPGGLNVVQALCGLLGGLLGGGCNLVESLGDPASQLFVISSGSNPSTLGFLLELLGIESIEQDLVAILVPSRPLIPSGAGAPAGLYSTSPVSFYGSTVWNGYANQPAAGIVRVDQARSTYHVNGAGVIGMIDTGVDPNHPALVPVLVPGYDFTRNQAGGSEMADLGQSTVALLDGGTPVRVNGSMMAVLDQSTVALLDNGGLADFGHGTMTAGIVHLVSPTSTIMPLKAFTARGTGYVSDIIRATYYAVSNGVDVLNMSFSVSGSSAQLEKAMDYAASNGLVCVAAAGNQGQNVMVYPAGYTGDAMGIGSTTMTDTRSSFSNYGSVVWVAAPGEGIISTYPMDSYGAGWGTSFSTPFVTGTAGLLLQLRGGVNEQGAAAAIAHAQPISGNLGHGRLDVMRALTAMMSGSEH